LPGAAQFHLRKADANDFSMPRFWLILLGHLDLIVGQQSQSFGMCVSILEYLNGLLPLTTLAAVDFAKVKDVALNYPVSGDALVFDDAPVTVFFAVFISLAATQKHNGSELSTFRTPWE
jgi:hypothetical protein